MKQHHTVLSIAGSDSGGGAGIQADIKSIQACGSFAMTAITAITSQNTLGVNAVFPVPVEHIKGQIEAVMEDIGAKAVKIGMLHDSEVMKAVREELDKYDVKNIVLDPVMVSTSGHKLMEDEAISTLKEILLYRARIITPNIPEAEIIIGRKIIAQGQLPEIARELSGGRRVSVMLKAGHMEDDELIDIFYNAETDEILELKSKRLYSKNTHGTGCTLSSAIAAFIAQGQSLNDAVTHAKDYIKNAIIAGADYEIGHGHGPVQHNWKDKL